MIPKIIHYCWFGGNPMPELAKRCLDSWKSHCPDYEIMEWNESNFDLNTNAYVSEAYKAKKWAFITDYVRLAALEEYGGVYMDTDVEVLAPLDEFLKNKAFSGFEGYDLIPTGIMASEKGNRWIKLLKEYYNDKHFIRDDGSYDMTTNVATITEITKANYPIKLNNTYQNLGDVTFYPCEYFCPKDYRTKMMTYYGEKTVTIHHFNGSWLSEEERNILELSDEIRKKYGKFIATLVKSILELRQARKEGGFAKALELLKIKIRRRI